MIELEKAQQIFEEQISHVQVGIETVGVRSCLGRTVAQDIVSRIDIPPFDKSAMDGYAMLAGDASATYRVLETVAAGETGTAVLRSGTCVKIMTGAPVPENAGRVVPVENTEPAGDEIVIVKPSSVTHICWKGEDIRKGQRVLAAGTRVNVLEQAVLITCGIETVPVWRRVKVAVFSTGNELVSRMDEWGPGKIFDSNGPMLRELMAQAGAEILIEGRLPDDLDGSIQNLRDAITQCDMIVLSGGVSMGDYDVVPDALRACGLELHFSRLKVKPGKPMTMATGPNTVVLGFPGNPVSSFIMFHLFGLPGLCKLQNVSQRPRFLALPAAEDIVRNKAVRLEFIPVTAVIAPDGGFSAVKPVPYHGSAHLNALLEADGFIIFQPEQKRISKGEPVPFWPTRLQLYENTQKVK